MKIYTRTGDSGTTALFGGLRVSKTHVRVRACGAVDELNAALGVARASLGSSDLSPQVAAIQARLFDIGADLATPPSAPAAAHVRRTRPEWVAELERAIDDLDSYLPPLLAFILPGGSAASAALHVARTVCRRAEREVVAAREAGEAVTPEVIAYLNRLADWLFTAARSANLAAGVPDSTWRGGA